MRQNELGNYLKLLRIKNNYTMTQTADVTGITQGYISQIENGIYTPSAKTLAKLARAYGVPEIHLLRKAGIVQLSSTPPRGGDKPVESNLLAEDPLIEVSNPVELMELLRRGLTSLEYLSDQIRQRGQVASLPAAPLSMLPVDQLSANISLPVYDANWQPLANSLGESAALILPAALCADDGDAFILTVSDMAMAPRISIGDWVVISPASVLKSGDVAAINDRNQIQLRNFTEANGTMVFTPHNPEFAFKSLVVNKQKEKVEIVGRVVRLINREL